MTSQQAVSMSVSSAERGEKAPRRSQGGLDWFAFFMADIQTGWGPFVAAYLTSVAWTQFDIGLILTIGTLAALALQIPAGALVDRVPAKRLLATIAVICVSGSALLLALWPTFGVVVGAKVLHAVASCLFGPVLAAISLGLVGYSLLSERLGRNVRFLSLGNAIAAGVMGGVGYYFSNQAIFFLTAALAIPTLVALLQIRPGDIDPDLARGGIRSAESGVPPSAFRSLLQNRALLIFVGAVLLFQFANAAALPIMAGLLTMRAPKTATLILSICIFAPQFVVAAIAPLVGRKTQSWGRRPLLMLCFIALSSRCAVFATTSDPYVVIAAQFLDGISAATLGVLVPLMIADVMRGSGHFNLAQGTVGAAVGLGASFSTALAGFVADSLGRVPVPCRNCRLRTRSRCRGHARDPRSAGEDTSRADTRVFERLRLVWRGNQTTESEVTRTGDSTSRFLGSLPQGGKAREPSGVPLGTEKREGLVPAVGRRCRPAVGPEGAGG